MQVKVYREIPVRIWESLSVTVEVNLRCHDNVILHSLSRKRIFLAPNMFLYRHMLQNNQQSVVYSTWTMDFMGSWTPRIQGPITPSNTVFFFVLFCSFVSWKITGTTFEWHRKQSIGLLYTTSLAKHSHQKHFVVTLYCSHVHIFWWS